MLQITQLTANARQQQTIILPNGKNISVTLYYVPMQLGWFITNLSYSGSEFEINGLRVTTNPNMLYQFKNQIPFGLACFTDGNQEPTQQEDFVSGRSKLYILTEEEVEEYTDILQA